MRCLLLYPYPVEPDGVSLQGYYLMKGLQELGNEVMPCDRADTMQKLWAYHSFKPDVIIGIGHWGEIPEVVHSPLNHGLKAVPWFNADGWIANYHNTLNSLPLIVATSNWVRHCLPFTHHEQQLERKNHYGVAKRGQNQQNPASDWDCKPDH